MRVPSTATVVVSIIHHIRVEGGNLVPVSGIQGENKEQILGFVAGFDSIDIGMLFTNLWFQWQTSVRDNLETRAGMTPKLFMAAIISQCRFVVGYSITGTSQSLKDIDLDLKCLKVDTPGKYKETKAAIQRINDQLIEVSQIIIGRGSELHYLANSNDALTGSASRFQEFIAACVQRWDGCCDQQDLLKQFQQLDSIHESARDRNQLELVSKSINQCQEEAQIMLKHININFGIVSQPITIASREIADWVPPGT